MKKYTVRLSEELSDYLISKAKVKELSINEFIKQVLIDMKEQDDHADAFLKKITSTVIEQMLKEGRL